MCMTHGESGHWVFGKMNPSSADKNIDRSIDVFKAAEKDMLSSMFSESVRALFSPTLV